MVKISETEKSLNFYRTFYYKLWENGTVSSDTLYNCKQDVKSQLDYCNDDINDKQVEKELEKLNKE